MTTNFTFRDFFVYLLSGLTLIICLGSIFIVDIFKISVEFFSKYQFVNNFSFLVSILLIPAIYVLGHIIGSISYNSLKLYVWLDNGYFKRPISPCKFFILTKLSQILYNQRVVSAILKSIRLATPDLPFHTVREFWTACATLQIEKIYSPAEYWYVLNELFNSINLIFFFSTIISFITGHWILGTIYFVLTIFAFNRAKQYAGHFVQTVANLSIARLQH